MQLRRLLPPRGPSSASPASPAPSLPPAVAGRRRWRAAAGTVAFLVAAALVVATVDVGAVGDAANAVFRSPLATAAALGAFGAAFWIRAAVWTRTLPGLSFWHALAGLHLATGANHVLPFRMGEPLRVASVVRRAGVSLDAAAASTVTLRAADLLALLALGWLASPAMVGRLAGGWAVPLAAVLGGVCAAGVVWLRRMVARGAAVRLPDGLAVLGTGVAWLFEAVLVWQAARFAGIDLTPQEAVLVTSVAVVAQLVAVAPGGFGTYEAAAVAAYTALGHPAGAALVAALTAHALKTAYTLVAGAVALAVPAPSFAGPVRLPRSIPPRPRAAVPDGPVVLVLPAHDEQATVGEVVRRAPETVAGRRVEVVVVDDGSTDVTGHRAKEAGADVLRLPANRGLGAAVRAGLAEGVRRGAAAVAFCDADGEYAPEEMERLVAPVLAGEVDYVVGSRFAGGPRRMRPHRWLGNRVLTSAVTFVTRQPVSDGQSGYRALSREAAARAEIAHDYNYAQVLTVDLVGKGFRYAEVPISYGFREHGRSFVRVGPYLARVVPAVLATVRRAGASVLDDVPAERVAGGEPAPLVEAPVGG